MLFVLNNKNLFLGAVNNSSYKCPFCPKRFKVDDTLYIHIDSFHKKEIPDNYTAKHYVYDLNHPGDHLCQICKTQKCVFNEKTGRYSTLCDKPECRDEARRRFKENYKKKHGKEHSIDDPEIQREMLKNRKTSGYYKFQDGGQIFYASSFEEDYLRFNDLNLEIPSTFITECDLSFEYTYEGKKHFYLPDYYIKQLDLIIEIKADEDLTHPKILAIDKEKEVLKDKAIIKDGKHNFIKIYDKDYTQYVALIKKLRSIYVDGKCNETDRFVVIPERAKKIRGFEMPKLDFCSESDYFTQSRLVKFLKDNADKSGKSTFQLVVDRRYVPEDFKNDEAFIKSNGNIICKTYTIDINDKNSLSHVFKEFEKYYTKQYEHFINQDYLSIRTPVVNKRWHAIEVSYIVKEKMDDIMNVLLDIVKNINGVVSYFPVETKLGFTLFLECNNIISSKHLQKLATKKEFFMVKDIPTVNILTNPVCPGTYDGGTVTKYLEDYCIDVDTEVEEEINL